MVFINVIVLNSNITTFRLHQWLAVSEQDSDSQIGNKFGPGIGVRKCDAGHLWFTVIQVCRVYCSWNMDWILEFLDQYSGCFLQDPE